MVLVITPGLSSKFDDASYEVLRKATPVTWKIAIPNAVIKERIVHVNRLKVWRTA